jgi:nitrate/nitrite-specific signal transduction histidine kinase
MELIVTPRLVRLSISDDGKGFTPRSERSAGMGLKTMQNRSAAIGASLSIRTESQEGTTITVECLNLSATAGNVADEPDERAGEPAPNSSNIVR